MAKKSQQAASESSIISNKFIKQIKLFFTFQRKNSVIGGGGILDVHW